MTSHTHTHIHTQWSEVCAGRGGGRQGSGAGAEQGADVVTVTGGHDVVEQWVDGGAAVEQHEGNEVQVLRQEINLNAGVQRQTEQRTSHMEGQPTHHKDTHYHHYTPHTG